MPNIKFISDIKGFAINNIVAVNNKSVSNIKYICKQRPSYNTLLLYRFNEGNGQFAFIDEAGRHSVMPDWYAGGTISTTEAKFGISSSLLTMGDWAWHIFKNRDPNIGDLNIFKDLNSTYTLECWCRPTQTLSRHTPFIFCDNNGSAGYTFYISNTRINFYVKESTSIFAISVIGVLNVSLTPNNWHHLLLYRKNNITATYLDGQQIGYTQNENTVNVSSGQNFGRGIWALADELAMPGYIDDLRLTKSNPYLLNPKSDLTDSYITPTEELNVI